MSSVQEQEAFVRRESCRDLSGLGATLLVLLLGVFIKVLLAHLQVLHSKLLRAPGRNCSNCTKSSLQILQVPALWLTRAFFKSTWKEALHTSSVHPGMGGSSTGMQ